MLMGGYYCTLGPPDDHESHDLDGLLRLTYAPMHEPAYLPSKIRLGKSAGLAD